MFKGAHSVDFGGNLEISLYIKEKYDNIKFNDIYRLKPENVK